MTSISRSISRSGSVDRRVGHGELDDPVGEDVAGAIERVALEPAADIRAQAGHVVERAHRLARSRRPLGHAPLAQLAQGGRELDGLAGQLGLASSPRGR